MLNQGYAYTTTIGSQSHGQALLSHLATLYPHSTPQAWQQKLDNQEVTLNGIPATGAESLWAHPGSSPTPPNTSKSSSTTTTC
jgi:23S rRNA pseudouridine1911/1915/1917 synthase